MSPEDRISDHPRPGRPRGFDEADALRAAMGVFWRQGFEASSLDDLTRAMGLSRSSFYACFGSKRDALIAAIGVYARDRREALKARLAAADGPQGRAEAVVAALADPEAGRNGCFMVNCLTELAPSDPEVAEIGRSHLERLTAIAAEALAEADPDRRRRARGGARRDVLRSRHPVQGGSAAGDAPRGGRRGASPRPASRRSARRVIRPDGASARAVLDRPVPKAP